MIAALSNNATVILASCLGLSGILVGPVLAVWQQLYLRRHLGKSNGQGTVSTMVETLQLDVDEMKEDRVEDRALLELIAINVGIRVPARRGVRGGGKS